METHDRIYVAGHKGMVGSALVRALQARGFNNLVTASRLELDLRDSQAVAAFFDREHPDRVILAAAKVGGIQANRQHPVEFLADNLAIQNNMIAQSWHVGVKQFVFLGSSCIYPRECPQPMKEEYLLTGPLEPTNEGYAIAKIAGLRLAQYYTQQYGMSTLSPMPCNLYGPNDSFDPLHSHVLSALVRKFTDAVDEGKPEVGMWGTGSARREFLHVDDMAEAVLFLMEHWPSPEIINVGAGTDLSIRELAELIAGKVGFTGQMVWDTNMPDGMPRKCMDVSKLSTLGFRPRISLEMGIDGVIADYRRYKAQARIKENAS
jgi:GDP-L-fucose synthase